MNPNDSGQPLSGSETKRPPSCQSCAGVPQVVQRILEAIGILKTILRGESVGRSLDQHVTQYAFGLTHSDLRRSLDCVLETIESTTREVNEVYPTSSKRISPLLPRPSSGRLTSPRIKRKLSPLNTITEKLVPDPSPCSGHPQSAAELPATPSGQDRQRNSLGELPCPPSCPICSTSRSISLPIKPTQASSDENTLPLLSPINYSPYILPPITPVSPAKAAPLTHFQDLQRHINTGFLGSQLSPHEDNDSLSALSQAQTRITILGRKCHACDAEISSLTKQRSILRARVESLEYQVQGVQNSSDEAQRHSATKGTQYGDIMAMASKIQAQGDLDMQKWKVEKEEWQYERQTLGRRIAVLQRENEVLGRVKEDTE